VAFIQRYLCKSTDGADNTPPSGVPTMSFTAQLSNDTFHGSNNDSGHQQPQSGRDNEKPHPPHKHMMFDDSSGMQMQESEEEKEQQSSSEVAIPTALEFEPFDQLPSNEELEDDQAMEYLIGIHEVSKLQQELVPEEHEQHNEHAGYQKEIPVKKESEVENDHGVQENQTGSEIEETVSFHSRQPVQGTEANVGSLDFVKQEPDVEKISGQALENQTPDLIKYSFETMNDDFVQDQWDPENDSTGAEASEQTVEGLPDASYPETQPNPNGVNYEHDTASQVDVQQLHNKVTKPTISSSQTDVAEKQNMYLQRIPQQQAIERGMNYVSTPAMGESSVRDQVGINFVPVSSMINFGSNASSGQSSSTIWAPSSAVQNKKSMHLSHSMHAHSSPEYPQKKQSNSHSVKLHQPSGNNKQQINHRNAVKKEHGDYDKTYGSNKAASFRKHLSLSGAQSHHGYDGPSGPSNDYLSPFPAPDAYNYWGPWPQPLIPTMPPHEHPQGQQQSGMYSQNSMYSSLHGPFQYGYRQSQMPTEYPYQQSFPPQPQHSFQMPVSTANLASSDLHVVPQTHGKRKAQNEDVYEHSGEGECESSDDDEPLLIRTRRHHSSDSQVEATISRRALNLGNVGTYEENPTDRDDEDVRVPGRKARLKLTIKKPPSKAPQIEPHSIQYKSAPPHRPLPQAIPQTPQHSNEDPESNEISWKLPSYAVEPQPTDPEEDQPKVKITLPNMIRETLLLSPDHATQETDLLRHLFLPGQQALAVPEPQPIIATLNFHNVAGMVLDAYAAFEAGDELTSVGRKKRGIPISSSPNTDEEAEHEAAQNDVRDADIDEIFLAVIDRWRAGKASNKKSYSLIRGVQEFCDIALDIIYYIHEHGLLREENAARVRKERCDKGIKRGPRGTKEEEREVGGKKEVGREVAQKSMGSGRGAGKGKGKATVPNKGTEKGRTKPAVAAKAKVNHLQARKKVKTGKERCGSITVIRKTTGKEK
jgi:hypothetical protein